MLHFFRSCINLRRLIRHSTAKDTVLSCHACSDADGTCAVTVDVSNCCKSDKTELYRKNWHFMCPVLLACYNFEVSIQSIREVAHCAYIAPKIPTVYKIFHDSKNFIINMAQSTPLITRIVASSMSATVAAGKIIRDVMNDKTLNIVEKGKNDLQTEADRSAQKCIVTSLSYQFPNVTIIGEEESLSCKVPQNWIVTDADQEVLNLELPDHLKNVDPKSLCIWVDPLDGTSEYTQGLVEHVTVLVGIAIGKRAVGGVIHQPYYKNESGTLGRTLWGIDGVGFGGFKLNLPQAGKRIITTTRSHSDPTVQAAIDAMKPDEVIRVGGAGHKVILLLEGKAHAYVFASKGCKKWDTCAPEAILHAVGGTLTDLYGERYSYNSSTDYPNVRGVLATAPKEIHQWYLSRISNEVKQKLC